MYRPDYCLQFFSQAISGHFRVQKNIIFAVDYFRLAL